MGPFLPHSLGILVLLFALPTLSAANLAVHYVDVGQGDATLIIYDGQAILIDGGGQRPEAGDKLARYLADLGVGEIILAVATHADPEHIGQLPSLAQKFGVRELWFNGLASESETWQTLNDTTRALGARQRAIGRADGYILGEDAILYALGPVDPLFGEQDSDSIVLRLAFKSISFLFTGDADSRAEARMVEVCGLCLGSDVLKLGSHGARTSTAEAFLDAVQPYVAVISAGQGNPEGYPHIEALDRLGARKIDWFRTDVHDALIDDVVATTDGYSLVISQASTGKVWAIDEFVIWAMIGTGAILGIWRNRRWREQIKGADRGGYGA